MTASTTRLHITPFSPDLLSRILGTEASRVATNISFHSLQTFPENSYGFVDLPEMEAQRIKKKLNGAILKGKKVKVEEARENKRKHTEDEVEDHGEEKGAEEVSQDKKRRKKERNVVAGHELSPDRKVKRGWTESKSEQSKRKRDKSGSNSKPQATSKYTEKDELLYKTKSPKNKLSQQGKKTSKEKRTEDSTVVHEFAKNTSMPSFLRNELSSTKSAVAYEDGKGWLDGEGAVVEQEGKKASKRRKAAAHGIEHEVIQAQPAKSTRSKKVTSAISASEESSVSGSSDDDDSDDVNEESGPIRHTTVTGVNAYDDDTSSSGSSELDSSSDSASDSAANSVMEDNEQDMQTPPPKPAVHPLEALFKKPGKPASSQNINSTDDIIKPSLEVQTSFSFFEPSDDNGSLPPMPMTPFSSQDLNSRELRSAAPTPDTAHPSRMSSIFNGVDSEGELSEMEDDQAKDEPISSRKTRSSKTNQLQAIQTDFEKDFWEKRGENNRAWKARRRAVLKEQRQRENRARRPKNW